MKKRLFTYLLVIIIGLALAQLNNYVNAKEANPNEGTKAAADEISLNLQPLVSRTVTTESELKAAIESASENDTIILGNDITVTELIVSKNLTFQSLSGKKVLQSSGYAMEITSDKDIVINFENVVLKSFQKSAIRINTIMDVTLNGAEITEHYENGIICEKGNLIINNCKIIGSKKGYDAGINASPDSNVYVNNSIIKDHSKRGIIGGNIYLSGNTQINNNRSELRGGGIFAYKDVVITGTSQIQENSSESGAAVYAVGNITITGLTDISNNFSMYGYAVISNEIINLSGDTVISNSYSAGIKGKTVNVTDNVQILNHNSDRIDGAGICGENVDISGNAVIKNNKSSYMGGGILGKHVTIRGNAQILNNKSGNGGGICTNYYKFDGENSLTVKGQAIISGNESSYSGGGFYSEKVILLDDAKINGNKSGLNGGGGIATSLLIDGRVQISNNSAVDGGGISTGYTGSPVNYKISGNTVISNNTASNDGGGINALIHESVRSSSQVLISGNVNIKENKAQKNGGGIALNFRELLKVDSPQVIFTANTASAAKTISEADKALHSNLIKTNHFSGSFGYGYNNYDIIYVTPSSLAKVIFQSNGPREISPQDKKVGAYVTSPQVVAHEHVFCGWYTDNKTFQNEWDFWVDKVPAGGLVLYAKWESKRVNITFGSDSGENIAPINNLLEDSYIPRPNDPVRNRHKFIGWYHDGVRWDFDKETIPKGIGLYAMWKPSFEVAYLYNTNDNYLHEYTFDSVGYDDVIPMPDIIPQRRGHIFLGWGSSENGPLWNYTTEFMPMDNVTLHAVWEVKPFNYIYYYENGSNGGSTPSSQYYYMDETVTIPDTIPEKNNSIFIGWRNASDNRIYNPGDSFVMPADPVYLDAQWITERSLSLNSFTGFNEDSFVIAGTVVELPKVIPFYGNKFVWVSEYDNKTYQPGESFIMPDADVWMLAEPIITYYVHYAELYDSGIHPWPEHEDIIYEPGEVVKVTELSIEQEGSRLAGWFSYELNKMLQPGDTFIMPEQDVFFMPVWIHEDE